MRLRHEEDGSKFDDTSMKIGNLFHIVILIKKNISNRSALAMSCIVRAFSTPDAEAGQ